MPRRPRRGKLYQIFTIAAKNGTPKSRFGFESKKGGPMVAGIAIAMFVALAGWGATYFGWSDPSGKVQLALVTSFILGVAASYKTRG